MERLECRQASLLSVDGVLATTIYDVTDLLKDFLTLPSLILTAVANAGAADLDVTVEVSSDGLTYVEALAFTTIAAGAGDTEALALPFAARYMQVTVTISAAGSYDIDIDAYGAKSVRNQLVFVG